MDTETPGIGDNAMSEIEAASARVDALIETANKWISTVPEIDNSDRAGKASDFRNQLRAMNKVLDGDRLATTKPLRDEATAINDQYGKMTKLLDGAYNRLSTLLDPWFDLLDRRKAAAAKKTREEADAKRKEAEDLTRKAAESSGDIIQNEVAAEEAQKAAVKADKTAARIAKAPVQVKGDLAPRATGRRVRYRANITNIDLAFDYYKEHLSVAETLTRLANADIRHGRRRRIPGFDIKSETSL